MQRDVDSLLEGLAERLGLVAGGDRVIGLDGLVADLDRRAPCPPQPW
jgi:hypothetical protein